MQVMCVKPINSHEVGVDPLTKPAIGDTDTVIETIEKWGHTYYILERFGKDNGYLTIHFATLPDADADEIDAAEKEAIVPAPSLYGNEHLHPIFQNILNSFITH